MISKMASVKNTGRHLCFKLDHATENGQKNKQRSTKHLTKENMLYDTINTIK
jgi:hypothetical protein